MLLKSPFLQVIFILVKENHKKERIYIFSMSLFLTGASKRRFDCLGEVPVSAGCGTESAGIVCQVALVEN